MLSPSSFLASRQTPVPPPTARAADGMEPRAKGENRRPGPDPRPGWWPAHSSAAAAPQHPVPSAVPSAISATSATKHKEAPVPAPAPAPGLEPSAGPADYPTPRTPSGPVRIPIPLQPHHDTSHASRQARAHARAQAHRKSHRDRCRAELQLDSLPPAVAALLALTAIPLQRGPGRPRLAPAAADLPMTVDSILQRTHKSEKEFSLTLGRGPLDVLLDPPAAEDDDDAVSASDLGSALSTRAVSLESVPSLAASFTTAALSSLDSPQSPSRRHRARPRRRPLTPVSSPPGAPPGGPRDHPLSAGPDLDLNELDFRVFQPAVCSPGAKPEAEPPLPLRPLKSAFKSNLTASLRALRNAARSFNLNLPSIPPEDFLTRSILTLDPRIPYTDERRPPPLDEAPSAALRRYLNPTTSAHIEPRPPWPTLPTAAITAFTASIQMQTYKIQHARSPTAAPPPLPRPRLLAAPLLRGGPKGPPLDYPLPGPRQRELRENSDFIRIAVMEMAMRKRGKLDDRKPGRARLALPPRKTSSKPYRVGPDGVPERWAAASSP